MNNGGKKPSLVLLAVAGAVLWFTFGGRLPAPVQPAPVPPTPAPGPVEPGSPLREAFAVIDQADRQVIGELYAALADAIERDARLSIVTSTAGLAEGIGRSIDLAFAGRKVSDGSLGVAIDTHLAEQMGFERGAMLDVVITAANRPKVVAALRSVAAAARQK